MSTARKSQKGKKRVMTLAVIAAMEMYTFCIIR